MLRLGWKNRCFIRCGLRSKVGVSIFPCSRLRRHTGGKTTENQHLSKPEEGGAEVAVFRIDEDKTRHISIEIHFNLKPIPEVEQVTA